MTKDRRTKIVITMGDGAGVGPEIIVKALSDSAVYERVRPVVVGDFKRLTLAESICHTGLKIARIETVEEAKFVHGTVECIDLDLLDGDLPFGQVSAQAGDAAYRYIERAVQLATEGRVDAITTAPLNKEALHMSGHNFPGHTQILAHLTHTQDFAMMFASQDLNVILVTIHLGLIDAVRSISPENVYRTIRLAHTALLRTGKMPRIAVCGVNPHAGENGLFGNHEEENQILPGVLRARAEGMNVTDPLPADTAFYLARRGDYDIVVAMYHDQGLGPVKVLGIENSVNITVGLPFIRTSVDHGTAFNIAGKGIADANNMKVALYKGAELNGA